MSHNDDSSEITFTQGALPDSVLPFTSTTENMSIACTVFWEKVALGWQETKAEVRDDLAHPERWEKA